MKSATTDWKPIQFYIAETSPMFTLVNCPDCRALLMRRVPFKGVATCPQCREQIA